jgi:hypothetical protein
MRRAIIAPIVYPEEIFVSTGFDATKRIIEFIIFDFKQR